MVVFNQSKRRSNKDNEERKISAHFSFFHMRKLSFNMLKNKVMVFSSFDRSILFDLILAIG